MNTFRGSRHAPRNFSQEAQYITTSTNATPFCRKKYLVVPLRLFCGLCGVIIIIPLLNFNVEEKNATHWLFLP